MHPADDHLPDGLRVVLDRRTITLDGGRVLLGGAPPRLLTLRPAAVALLVDGALTVEGRTSRSLARRLLDAGIAHPVHAPAAAVPTAADVTVVVPVKDRTDGLARLLARLAEEDLGGLVVVDDGSADPAAVPGAVRAAGFAVEADAGATGPAAGTAVVLRHERARGPASARNAGLAAATTAFVAFLDSDVVPETGWLEPLLALFADPAVGLAAPRIVALPPVTGVLGRYEAVRSSLDLGVDPALVVPRSRVAYVPSAAVLVRRSAVGAGFDEALHVAEDVDLVLRLHAAGWRLRYEPAARVAHDHRTTLRSWWLRKAFYGTGAAPLALRHEGAVPPMVLSATSAAVTGLILVARPWALAAAGGVAAVAAGRLSRQLTVEKPLLTAAQLVGLGAYGAAGQTADAVTRHFWPLSLAAALVSRRARRRVLVIALVEGVHDWWEHRHRDERVRPGVAGHLVAHRLDDLAYGAGLWWGAWRHRTLAPLRPTRPGPARGARVTAASRRVTPDPQRVSVNINSGEKRGAGG